MCTFSVKILLLVMLLVAEESRGGVSVQGVPPSSDTEYVFMESPYLNQFQQRVVPNGSYFLNAQYSLIDRPLVEQGADGAQNTVVNSLRTIDLRSTLAIDSKLSVSVNLSLNNLQTADGKTEASLGDSVLQLKYQITGDSSKYQVALIPEVYLPVGAETRFLSTGKVGSALKVAMGRRYDNVLAVANVGYRYLPGNSWRTLDYQNQFVGGIGITKDITPTVGFNFEALGYFSNPYTAINSPGELLVGTTWDVSKNATIQGSISTNGFDQSHNNSYRGVIGLKYLLENHRDETPERVPLCTIEPFNTTLHSRPLTADEFKKVHRDLPYKSDVFIGKEKQHIKTIQFGEMTGVTTGGIPFVENSQIPFVIDLANLPTADRIKVIHYARLKMKINKLTNDSSIGTEMICLLNNRKCSGKPIESPRWAEALNEDYFPGRKHPENTTFSEMVLKNKVGKFDGKNLFTELISYPMDNFLTSGQSNLRHLFEKSSSDRFDVNSLFFAIADDTFVSNDVVLELSMGVEVCH